MASACYEALPSGRHTQRHEVANDTHFDSSIYNESNEQYTSRYGILNGEMPAASEPLVPELPALHPEGRELQTSQTCCNVSCLKRMM